MKTALASPLEFLASILLAALCIAMLSGCGSTRVVTRDGTEVTHAFVGSETTVDVEPDGKIHIHGNGEKAIDPIAKALKTKAMIGMGETVLTSAPGIANALKK